MSDDKTIAPIEVEVVAGKEVNFLGGKFKILRCGTRVLHLRLLPGYKFSKKYLDKKL